MKIETTLSATIEHGVTTNRVVVHAQRPAPKPRGKGRYRRDRASEGGGTVVISISVPPAELEMITAAAERVQMSRSRFLRQAAKHFAARVAP